MRSSCFRIDWLSCSDQGVAADFMGGVFFHVIKGSYVPGTNRRERCIALWERIRGFHHQRQVTDRFSNLTLTMTKKNGTSMPKLRCSAAECRALVPFFGGLGGERPERDDLLDEAVTVVARSLLDCYVRLGLRERRASRVVGQVRPTVGGIGVGGTWRWGLKPKLHLWLEVCASRASPFLFWTHRDEDFGGTAGEAGI